MTKAIPGVILAGGKATRMGGGDKGLLHLGQKRLIDHVVQRLKAQCAPLVLNANGDAARFSDLGLPVLPDSISDFPGPLAGVLAGLDWAYENGADHIVTAAADTPFFPENLADILWANRGPSGLCLAASPGEGGRVYRQPTFGLWPVALRNDLRKSLMEGLRKIVLWTEKHQAGQAVFEGQKFDPFFNINTPEDLKKAKAILAEVST